MKLTGTQKIGIFVTLMSVALIFAINFLKGYDIFNKNSHYYTYLKDVEGLSPTSPVYIRGLKVGSIEKIEFNPLKDSFLVKMSVKNDYIIPQDTKAEMYSSDLLGGRSLRLALGSSNIQVKNGDTLAGKFVPDIIAMVQESVAPIAKRLNSVLGQLDKTLTTVNNAIDSTTAERVKASVAELNATLSNTRALTASLNKELAPQLEHIAANLAVLSDSLASPEGDFSQILANLHKTTDEIASMELSQTIDKLNDVLQKIGDPNGSVGKLLSTPQLHNSLDSLVSSLDTLVKRITAKPRKYIKISVF